MITLGTLVVGVFFLALFGAMLCAMNLAGRRMYQYSQRMLRPIKWVKEWVYYPLAGGMALGYVGLAWGFGLRWAIAKELQWITGGESVGLWLAIIFAIITVIVFTLNMMEVRYAAAKEKAFLDEVSARDHVERDEREAGRVIPIPVYEFTNEGDFAARRLVDVWDGHDYSSEL